MRKVLSLLLLVSIFILFTTNGCGNTGISDGEEKVVADNENIIPDDNIKEAYKTASFALG